MKRLFAGFLVFLSWISGAFATPDIANFDSKHLIAREIITAPFVVEKRYKSMEGPTQTVTITPEGLASREEPLQLTVEASETNRNVSYGVIAPPTKTRHLMWFLGAKIEVLAKDSDEVISPEYMCHLNIDTNLQQRRDSFPMSPGTNTRVLTLTGGAMSFYLPPGYGLPVASNEEHEITFQVLNHNRDEPIAVRHRLTLYYVRDQELNEPMKPLTYAVPFIAVPVDEGGKIGGKFKVSRCTCCTPLEYGAEANNAIGGLFDGPESKKYSAHWSVPPGKSEYTFPLRYYARSFGTYPTTAHALIPHIHPYCTEISVYEFDPSCSTRKLVYTSKVENRKGETGLVHVDRYSSVEGLPISPLRQYELSVKYDNTSGIEQDSMATMAIFTHDTQFFKPQWSNDEVRPIETQRNDTTRFDPEENVTVIFNTSAGPIEVELNCVDHPDVVYPFLQRLDHGSFDGVEFYRTKENAYAQTNNVSHEKPGLQVWDQPVPREKKHGDWGGHRGTLVMAVSDRPSHGNSSFLLSVQPMRDNPEFVTIGRITKGLRNLYALTLYETDADSRPLESIKIETATRVGANEAEMQAKVSSDPLSVRQMLAPDENSDNPEPIEAGAGQPAGMVSTPTISDEFESCGVVPRFDAYVTCSAAETDRGNHLLIKTSLGDMLCELYPQHAPAHVAQIKKLVVNKCFNEAAIVRIDRGFVAQVEELQHKRKPLTGEQKSLLARLPLEVSNDLKHEIGTLSMARSDDPNSGQSSFSFLLGPAPHMDGEYTIFGKVIDGHAVLSEIEARATADPYKPEKLVELREVLLVRPTDAAIEAAEKEQSAER